MSWQPSTADLETVATMTVAKAPTAAIAAAVGIASLRRGCSGCR